MTLRPLHGDDAQLLVEHVTEGTPLRPGEVATLVERAGGSPLFLEELVRVARDLGVDGLPESLDGVAAAEIDSLAPLARTALRMAAVLGRSFETTVLVRMLDEDGIVLDDATQRDLSRFLIADGPDRFQFRHALQREAAYEGLAFRRRQHLHARAARTLLREPGSGSEVRPDLLSLHFTRAHDWNNAWEYAMQAGLEAELAYAAREVVTHYGHAIEAARRIDAVDRDVLSWIWERLGDAHDLLGSLPEADAAYRRAAQLLDDEDAVNLARLGDKRVVVVGEHQHRHAAAVRIARRFRRVLGERTDPPAREVRAQLLAHEAAIRYHEGRFRESVKLCDAAMTETDPGEEPLALATALSVSDMARYRLGLPGDPALTERALAIFERHDDLVGVAVTLANLGVLAYFDGRWDAAADLYQRAVTAAERSGDAVEAAVGAANLAELRINQGRITEAESLLKPAVRTLDAMAETLHGGFASMQMGRIEATRLDAAAMRSWMERAVNAYDAVGANEDATLARAFFAESELLTNGVHAAAALVRQARAGAPIEPDAPAGVLLDRVEAMVCAARDDLPNARTLAGRALENARASGAYYDLVVALELCRRHADGDGRAELERERDRWIGHLGIEGPIRSGPPAT
jgi:tetratricopeptide (TPR) repeat protein